MTKSTEIFKKSIQKHLQGVAESNEFFAEKLKNPKKNIDDCITYILNQVQKSGRQGFEDSEVYGIAMHYYDEENVEVGGKVQASIVMNHEIQLTEEEIEELKEKARKKVVDDEIKRLTKKPKKKEVKEIKDENTLF